MINGQYSIEFVPILSLVLIDVSIKLKSYQVLVIPLVCILTIGSSIQVINERVSKWYSPINSKFYDKSHYQSDLNVSEIHKALKIIPKNAIVSTVSVLAPHLAFRKKIYHFPNVKDANYIVLITKSNYTYPLIEKEFSKIKNKIIRNNKYAIVYYKYHLLILKK